MAKWLINIFIRRSRDAVVPPLGIDVGKNVICVVMSVRVSVMCCGSVQHIVAVELTSC